MIDGYTTLTISSQRKMEKTMEIESIAKLGCFEKGLFMQYLNITKNTESVDKNCKRFSGDLKDSLSWITRNPH
jgi:hypothetical protein